MNKDQYEEVKARLERRIQKQIKLEKEIDKKIQEQQERDKNKKETLVNNQRMEETPPPNPERNTGTKPKLFFQKNKRWNIMNQRENQHTQYFKNKKKQTNNEHIDKLKKGNIKIN